MDKKFVMGIAAMAALTLVSCSSDDLDSFSDNSSKNEAISFDGYLGRSAVAVNGTRSIMLNDIKALQDLEAGFGVFSKYTDGQTSDPVLFSNQPVTYKNSKWTYSPLRFWPTQGPIDFLAYAPYDAKYTKLTGNSFEFTVENKVADQKDLLWANATNQTKDNISKTGNKVKFQFAHALSRLGYTVKLYQDDPSNATFTLKKITLAGSADGTAGTFYTKGTIDLSKTSSTDLWNTSASGKQKFDWDYSTNPLEFSKTKTEIKNAGTEYLFVIPQDFSGADQLYVIVEYDIHYKDINKTIKNKVYKQLTNKKFEQGHAYMLNLTIGLPIEFDADVTPWTKEGNEETGIDIDSWEDINH
ncbi:MAG TPA: fimbrillin family protein [Prevotella sp.]|jgi:hypothetical protein|nr:fimbrillin family protein [Prevotella sp.]